MLFPKLKNIPTSKDMLDVFKGYNHNIRIGEGEFYEMTNLSSDDFPVLSPRRKRGSYIVALYNYKKLQGLISKDGFCYVGDSYFIINRKRFNFNLSTDKKLKNIVSMGTNVIFFPDLKYVDLVNYSGYQTLLPKNIASPVSFYACHDGNVTTIFPCRADGTVYTNVIESEDSPYGAENGTLWIHGSSWYVLDVAQNIWRVAPKYAKIFNGLFTHDYTVGDRIKLTFPVDNDGNKNKTLINLSGEKEIIGVEANAIIIEGQIEDFNAKNMYKMLYSDYGDKKITIDRIIPNMDFVISCGNRLWGCRSGKNSQGSVVNEIYASALGDFSKWYRFEGVSTDSYIASVGSDGPFTGAIEYKGNPIFFKENCMHIVYGDYPSNYKVKTVNCRGVQRGCENSLAILNEKLYYKSTDGICVYDGSLPVDISAELGGVFYKNAAAGVLKDKYYISMCDSSDMWHLFVYDSSKGLWHREDDTHATCFCAHDGDLYYIDYADNSIKTVKGSVDVLESTPIKWEAVSGILGTSSPDKKYISRLDVRMMLDVGSTVTFYAEYDSCGTWEHLFTMAGRPELRSFTVPVRPRRCDHLRLKIVGVGNSKIFSICKTYETGSGD